LRRELHKPFFLFRSGWRFDAIINGLAKFFRKLTVDFSRIAARSRRDFRREQARDDSIFVRRPNAPVPTEETRARALLSSKAKRAIEQTIDEPLEANRHFKKLAAKLCRDAINHLTAHDRFADGRFLAPLR